MTSILHPPPASILSWPFSETLWGSPPSLSLLLSPLKGQCHKNAEFSFINQCPGLAMDPSVSLILYMSFKVDVYKHSKPWLVNFRGSRSCNQSEPTVYRIYLSNLNPLIMYCDSCGDLDDSLCGTLPKQLSPRDPLFSSLLQSSSCNTNSEIPAHHKSPSWPA